MTDDYSSFDAVARMIKQAEENGLLVEVVHTFGMSMAHKLDDKGRVPEGAIKESSAGALIDWDC